MSLPRIGLVISTHDRVDDARCNMEIVRSLWRDHFDVRIVHAYNGDERAVATRGLEDDLVIIENRGHFRGAIDLINMGMRTIREEVARDDGLDYAVHLSADTWLANPTYLAAIVDRMRVSKMRLATCPWGSRENGNHWRVGMALDFFVVDLRWATEHRLFPIDYDDFVVKHGELVNFTGDVVYPERVFALRFLQAMQTDHSVKHADANPWAACDERIYRIRAREPVHDDGGRRMWFPEVRLLTHHEPKEKQRVVRDLGLGACGPNLAKLAEASDLSYWNRGANR
jgi:hypothetical protein